DRVDADEAAARAVVLELDDPGDLGEQRIVLAEADVLAGVEATAALADEDRAAGDEVAVVALDAEPLGVAVAPVARAALTFLMCHCRETSEDDVLDGDAGQRAAMSLRLAEALAALLLEDADLRSAGLAFDDADDAGVGHEGRAGDHVAAVLADH